MATNKYVAYKERRCARNQHVRNLIITVAGSGFLFLTSHFLFPISDPISYFLTSHISHFIYDVELDIPLTHSQFSAAESLV